MALISAVKPFVEGKLDLVLLNQAPNLLQSQVLRDRCVLYELLVFNVEVDQSGKVERTQVNTVLALSDGIEASILILAVEKRECIRRLRQRGETGRTMYLKLFVAGLFLLLKDYLDQLQIVTIDMEYPGKEAEIRAMLLDHIWKTDPTFSKERIVFRRVGKKSRAHRKALAVYRGEEGADRKVRARELLRLVK